MSFKRLLCVALFVVAVANVMASIGGLNKMDPNDPEIQRVAKEAVDHLSKNDKHADYKLGSVLSAASQVVAGLRYVLRIMVVLDCHGKICMRRPDTYDVEVLKLVNRKPTYNFTLVEPEHKN